MTKLRTANAFQDALDHEHAWRIRELSDLRMAIRSASAGTEKTLIRASIALLYAHWEGFVKTSTEQYLEYLSSQGLSYNKLQRCYIAFGLKGHLLDIALTKKAKPARVALDFILDNLEQRAHIPFRGAIDTESNLRSHVFASIAGWIGVDVSRYETKFTLIDKSLCDRRNSIAHGQYLELDAPAYIALSDEVIQLLRGYKTDLENMVTMKSYLAA